MSVDSQGAWMTGIQWVTIVILIGILMYLAGMEWLHEQDMRRERERNNQP